MKNSVVAFIAVLIVLVSPLHTPAQKDVKVTNSPSEPVPVTGTVNVGNIVQFRPVIPTGAFSLSTFQGSARVSGPDPEGTSYAISSLTVANLDSIALRFAVIGKFGTTSDCLEFTGLPTEVVGPVVKVPAGETVHLLFPQPFILRAKPGTTACLSALPLEGEAFMGVVGYRF